MRNLSSDNAADRSSAVDRAIAKNGQAFVTRPFSADDRHREIRFLDGLSAETRQLRLFLPLQHFSSQLIDQFMDVDGHRRAAFAATVGEGDDERFIGVARYAALNEREVEFALTVADEWQRLGVGSRLLRHLMAHAKAHRFSQMSGSILSHNHGMLALARKLDFHAIEREAGYVRVRCDLREP